MTQEKYNFANPKLSNLSILSDIVQDVRDLIESGEYILGKYTNTFEEKFAKYIGSNYCVGVNSGTDALILGMKVLGIGKGDEVILPSLTATATGAAVLQVGATPVFVDIDPRTYTIDQIGRAHV